MTAEVREHREKKSRTVGWVSNEHIVPGGLEEANVAEDVEHRDAFSCWSASRSGDLSREFGEVLALIDEVDGVGLDNLKMRWIRVDCAHGRRESTVATGSAPHAALGTRARRVGTTILPMRDTQVRVVRLVLDAFDSLDGVRNVREVDERAVPRKHQMLASTLLIAK